MSIPAKKTKTPRKNAKKQPTEKQKYIKYHNVS